MQLEQAYKTTKELNTKSKHFVHTFKKSPYGGYRVEFEPVELRIIKDILAHKINLSKGFLKATKDKYGI